MIGQTISHYKILEKIGEGGMGVVYKATDTRLFRPVAIKTLPAELISNSEYIQRFIREARTTSSMNHPNICTIYDICEEGGYYLIVMEYVEGRTLREILDQRGSLPVREVLEIGIKICNALKAAHAKGIIHRDIKPENIMISSDGFVKVMDFGLAKLKNVSGQISDEIQGEVNRVKQDDLFKTSMSSMIGTAAYMSPEQIENRPVDERSDIFSLGVVLYEMLTGKNPFSSLDRISILQSILEKAPEPLLNSGNSILEPVISKARAKSPADRYENMENLCLELESIQAKLQRNWFNKKRNFIFAGFILFLFCVLILLGPFNILRNNIPQLPKISKIVPLGLVTKSVEWPTFSPDGEHILYTSNQRAGGGDLIKRNIVTGKEEKLFHGYALMMMIIYYLLPPAMLRKRILQIRRQKSVQLSSTG